MSEPRVLMVACSYAPARDGVARQTHRLAKALVAQGVPVTVVTQTLADTEDREIRDGVNVVRLRAPQLGGYRRSIYPFIGRMLRYIIQHRDEHDIIHVHQMLIHAAAAVGLARALGKASLVKVAGGGGSGNISHLRRWRVSGALSLRVLHGASRVISLSEQVTSELVEVGFARAQIVELPDGIEVDQFSVRRTSDTRHVMAAARLSPEKGVDLLVAAWSYVRRSVPDASLTILGAGPERDALLAQARGLGVAESIAFVGEVEDVRPFLARSIFALPSRNEGMSNALLEAMAAGCPIVASDISPNRSVVDNGRNGLLFRGEDPADLGARLIELLLNSELAATLGAHAAADAMKYSIDEVARRHRELYAEILEARSRD